LDFVYGSWRSDRARFASLTRSRPADDPELIAARQAFKAGLLAEQVRRAVNEPPALTGEQLAEIGAILAACPHKSERKSS
jgi:hypothetical protein